jgi:hypothetical protein
MPCNALVAIRKAYDDAKTAKNDEIVYKASPKMKILFNPLMSANRPKGTMKIAAASKYDVAIQLSLTASIENS